MFFPLGLWRARNGAKASAASRSAAAAKAGAESPLASRPDPEVVAKPKRRSFTAEYKLRILTEAEAAAATPGGLGAPLRREGLYSSLLAYWRRERANGIIDALTPQKRGPKSKRHPLEEENLKLQRQSVLDVAYRAHPERFVRRVPKPSSVRTEVWINKPVNTNEKTH